MSGEEKITNSKVLVLADSRPLIRAFWMLTFVILTAIGAQIEIPVRPVPFTLQTFFVLMAGALLGKRMGTASMILYVILGILGLPVFSGGTTGVARIMGPTGGYLLSFPVVAFLTGYLTEQRKEYWWLLVSMTAGALVYFFMGLIYLNFIFMHDWTRSFNYGFLIFSWWDMIKIAGAATIARYYFRKVNF
jgi:biotin transport system substrate-specific component